jgi:hypothetical protein
MRLYLTLAEGESAATAETIFATCDQQLIDTLARAICRRVGAEPPARLAELSRRRRSEPDESGDPDAQ